MNLKQLKLTNDDEIICEVIDVEDVDGEVVIRKVLKLMCIDDFERNVRYYSFKPWMSFTDDIEGLQTLNSGHIVGQMNPSKTLAAHYAHAVKEVERGMKTSKTLNLDEVLKDLDVEELTEEDMDEYLKMKFSSSEEEFLKRDDSSDPKIIQFRPKNTIH